MAKAIVRLFSHHFSVKLGEPSPAMRSLIFKFASTFDQYEWQQQGGNWHKEWAATYASPSPDIDKDWKDPDLEFRFHINSLDQFKELLSKAGAKETDVRYEVEPTYESKSVKIEIKDHFKPFDYQVPILEQLFESKPISKLLGLQTGQGKSACSVFAARHFGKMTVCIMKLGYIDKWVNDIKKQCNIEFSQIETVSGFSELIHLINGLHEGRLTPTFVLIANATFRNWISEQEKLPPGDLVPGFPIEPWEFMQYCGFGFRIIDEVHQDYHANFKFDLFTHIEQSLSLSATLVTRNEYLMKMYELAYPETCTMKVPEYKKYIRSIAWFYELAYPDNFRTSNRGRTTYSHIAFEQSLEKQKRVLAQYLHMVYDCMRKTYLFERKKGEKCLIYFSTKKMCEEGLKQLRKHLPDLKFARFNQGDNLETALKADVIVATLQKAGTAIDIPNLTTVILTVAIDSIQSNLQSFGRLRDLKQLYGSDRVPTFVYFTCRNFYKHLNYHKSKQQMVREKALASTTMHHGITLGL